MTIIEQARRFVQNDVLIASETEEAIFTALGMEYVEPWNRECILTKTTNHTEEP